MKENLERFIEAQNLDYETALNEMKDGQKKTHWIWYIFPQLKGLGTSYFSDYYGISGKEEAKEYMKNDFLKAHLLEITQVLLDLNNKNIQQIMPYPDDLKLKSCMTLFYEVTHMDIFKEVLEKYYNGEKDSLTLKILEKK